jgi:hypothetical protein
MADLMVSSDEKHEMIPNLTLAQLLYEYEVKSASSSSSSTAASGDATSLVALKNEIFSIIEANNMTDVYVHTCERCSLAADDAKLLTMR